ncbi:MAG: hypothetical protein JWN96_3436, partial [Mycobacterium sp.]|nr:hypothetical protein [Mycobacterium sp.]
MPRYLLAISHPPTRDGLPNADRHVPFYLALEAAADGWALALEEFCGGLLKPSDVAVVHVTSNFRREIFVGPVNVDVTLTSIGTSSISFMLELVQGGHSAGSVRLVVAKVDPLRLEAVPLTSDEAAALAGISRRLPEQPET